MKKRMSPKRQRLIIVLIGLIMLGGSAALLLNSLGDNLIFFFTPSQLEQRELAAGQVIRLGGVVKDDSVETMDDRVRFVVTDYTREITVEYSGVLPALFREGQGVVAQGSFEGTEFKAATILAKHDENYMPAEVTNAIKASGQWKPENYKLEE